MIRVIIAAFAGGIAMFCWGAFSHMVLPFADGGARSLPNEPAVVAALEASIKEPGFYFAPGMEDMHNASAEQQAAWAAKYEKGPTATIIYHPTGQTPMSPKQFGTEFASNVLASLFVAVILGLSGAGFLGRIVIATLVGAAGWASISLSQWNWYRFPTSLVMAEGFDQIVGWFLTGIVLAIIVKRREIR